MTQTHPITPPDELVKKIRSDALCGSDGQHDYELRMIHAAYAAGADQELEASVAWLDKYGIGWTGLEKFRNARRPKPEPVAQEVMTVNELAAIIYEVDPRTDTLCSPCMSSEELAEGLLSHPRFHAPSTAPAIQPEPVAPTDEEILKLAAKELCYTFNESWFLTGRNCPDLDTDPCELLDFARAVLARWGTPANTTINQNNY
jgi:hypothetical protein